MGACSLHGVVWEGKRGSPFSRHPSEVFNIWVAGASMPADPKRATRESWTNRGLCRWKSTASRVVSSILWMDEIHFAFSGTSSSRPFFASQRLTWTLFWPGHSVTRVGFCFFLPVGWHKSDLIAAHTANLSRLSTRS